MEEIVMILQDLYRHELTLVVRYTNFSVTVGGLDRLHLEDFFAKSASDSMGHAAQVGQKILSLGGMPQGKITEDLAAVPATSDRMLEQALKDEETAVVKYADAVPHVKKDLALREMLVHLLKEEQEHVDELRMLLRK